MKAKTHSGTKKRVKKTGSGKLIMAKACRRHLLVNKSKRQKNVKALGVDETNVKKLRKLLPN